MVQWGGHRAINQKVASSIPGQGTGLGCRFGPPGCGRGNQSMLLSHQCFLSNLLPFPYLSLSQKKEERQVLLWQMSKYLLASRCKHSHTPVSVPLLGVGAPGPPGPCPRRCSEGLRPLSSLPCWGRDSEFQGFFLANHLSPSPHTSLVQNNF